MMVLGTVTIKSVTEFRFSVDIFFFFFAFLVDVGKVSSFSYFRNQGPEKPGSKGFDQAFNVHAGRNIAIQFKQHMFDQTGFPGKIE